MRRRLILLGLLLALTATALLAQRSERRARVVDDRAGAPTWELDNEFRSDVFTFVRVRYPSGRFFGWEKWTIDFPDADLNFSFRLQQLTALKTHPDGRILELTDRELWDYPFIYIIEPGDMTLIDGEVAALRRYLLAGGFLMVDDFWGDREWENFYREIRRVFPDREVEELGLEHEIFHAVFPLKEKPQIPNVRQGTWSQHDGVTWEPDKEPGARDPHYRAIYDDKRRVMVVICHNTDLGDGWEREGENEYYFREFSEKKAYPLGINIIFYAMTH